MYRSDRLLYLDLQKTGSTAISRILAEVDGGTEITHASSGVSKHGRFESDRAGRFVLGSVRDPWSWYVSLWSYGRAGKGEVYRRSVSRAGVRTRLAAARGREPARSPAGVPRALRYAVARGPDPERWERSYAADDPALFRTWLRDLHDPGLRAALPYDYWRSPLSEHVGLLTFRLLWLYARDIAPLWVPPRDAAAARAQVEETVARGLVCDAFVRIEHLDRDLVEALEDSPVGLTAERRRRVRELSGTPRNPTPHRPYAEYYDDETVDLVARRDGVVASHFGYHPPTPTVR
jgi:hypothetical protein